MKTKSTGNRCLTINESMTMKKIYSFMVAAVALFAAVSCNKEMEQENLPAAETVVYTAYADGSEPESKAELNQTTLKSEWVAGDAITVLDGTKPWKFETNDEGAHADFANSEGFGDFRPVIAVYPAGQWTADIANKTVNAYIPTYQEARQNTYNENAVLSVAYSENNSFAFKNACALLKFTVKGEKSIKAIEFCGNNEEAITGNVLVSLNDDNTVKSVEGLDTDFVDGDNSRTGKGTWVKLYSVESDWCYKEGIYYAAIAPANFTKGFSLNLILADDSKVEAFKKRDEAYDLKANTILNLGEIEYVAPEAPVAHPWAVAGTFNDWNTISHPMVKDGDFYVARNITGLHFTSQEDIADKSSSTGIQFLQQGTWRGGYGDTDTPGKLSTNSWSYFWNDNGKNIYIEGASADTPYDIYLNPETGKYVVVPTGSPMPEDKPTEDQEVTVDYWAVIGSMTDNWASEVKMKLEGDWYVANNIKITDSDVFKFRANGNWDEGTPNRGAGDNKILENDKEVDAYQGGQDFQVADGGFYSLYLNKTATKVKVVKTAELPVVELWGVCGTFTGGWDITQNMHMTALGDGWYNLEGVEIYKDDEFKFVVDDSWSNSLGVAGDILVAKAGEEYTLTSAGGKNIKVSKNGKYTISLNPTEKKFKVVCTEDYIDLKVKITIDNKANWSPLYIYLESNGTAITPDAGAQVTNNEFEISGDYIGSSVVYQLISGSKKSEKASVTITRDGAKVSLEETYVQFIFKLETDNAKRWWGKRACMYIWNSGTSADNTWPGVEMTYDENYTWHVNLPSELAGKQMKYIINNGNGWQSADQSLTLPASGYTAYETKIGIK